MTPREELERLRRQRRLIELESRSRPPQTVMDRVEGFTGSVAQGALLGFPDEIGAAIGAPVRVLTGQAPNLREGFQMARREGMAQTDRFQAENPITATVAEIGGALPTALIGGGAGVARTAGQAALRGAGAGAALGGVYGAGTAEGGLGERAQGAMGGAAFGAAGGALAGVAGQQLARAWNGFRAARAGRAPTTADREAMNLLRQNLRTLGYADDEITTRINRAASSGNSEQALFEVFDDAHQMDLARTIKSGAQVSPAASSAARNFAETRRAGQQDRLQAGMRNAINDPDFSTMRANLQMRFQGQAAPIFRSEALRTVPVTPQLREIVRAVDAERVRMPRAENQGLGVPSPLAITRDGQNAPTTVAFGSLHDLAQDLSDDTSQLFRAGRGNQASRLRALDRQLRDYLKEVSPAFREASQIWRSARMDEDALEAGRRVFTTDPEDLAEMATDFSESERAHFVAGVARAFREKIRGASETGDATRRLASNNLRDRLRAAIGDDAESVIAMLDDEARLASNENALNPFVGSQTSPLQQGAQAFVPPGRRAAATAMETDLTLGNVRRAGAQAMRTPDPRMAESYVGLLLSPQGQALSPRYQAGLLGGPAPRTPIPAGLLGRAGAAATQPVRINITEGRPSGGYTPAELEILRQAGIR